MADFITYSVRVTEEKTGLRLDRYLSDIYTSISRTRIKYLITTGQVFIDKKATTSPSNKVKAGEYYEIRVPPLKKAKPEPQKIPIEVLFEDKYLIVVNKSSGMVVHPGAGNADNTLVNALLYHCDGSLSGIGGVTRPGIVHRLDKDTSGVMVIAKTDQVHRHLSKQFENRTTKRAYKALVWGVPEKRKKHIKTYIGRNPGNRKKMMSVNRGGKLAATEYEVEKILNSIISLIHCRLLTGRTHQIRVHMSEMGHPIIGDPVYGGRSTKRISLLENKVKEKIMALKGQALHAFLLGFEHPKSGRRLLFNAELSEDIEELLAILS